MDKPIYWAAEFVSFVALDEVRGKYAVLSVKVPLVQHELVQEHAGRLNAHAYRWYRDAFARGLYQALHTPANDDTATMPADAPQASAARCGASAVDDALVEHWRELETALDAGSDDEISARARAYREPRN